MRTIDRCVEIHWGAYYGHVPLIWPKKTQNCSQKTAVLDEEQLKSYLKKGFALIDDGKITISQNRYEGSSHLGFIPFTSYRKLASGDDLVSFVERFLGFTEEEIPYSEEAYSLQASLGWWNIEKTKDWSKEKILEEIAREKEKSRARKELLEACGQR